MKNVIFALMVIFIVSCTTVVELPEPTPTPTPVYTPPAGNTELAGDSQELKTFASEADLLAFLKSRESSGQAASYGRGAVFDVMEEADSAMATKTAGSVAPQAMPAAEGGADEYSSTNV